MQLVMFVGKDAIAAVHVNARQLTMPGYVGSLKRRLLKQNKDLLACVAEAPEFLFVNTPSAKKQ